MKYRLRNGIVVSKSEQGPGWLKVESLTDGAPPMVMGMTVGGLVVGAELFFVHDGEDPMEYDPGVYGPGFEVVERLV